MSFGKRGAAATRPTRRASFATTAASADGSAAPTKSTVYDTRRQASLRADAARNDVDARYTRLAVIAALVVVAALGLYSLADLYMSATTPAIRKQ
jgi:hypothetical protein